MKTTSKLFAIGAMTLAFQAAFAADIQALNGIAVEVNSGVITYGDIERAVRTLQANPANKGIERTKLIQAAHQQLLERALLSDAAREQGLKAGNEELESELKHRAQVQNISVDELYKRQAALGWTREQYRLDVAKDLVLERLLANINDSVKISDEQVNAYIAQAQKDGQALPKGEPYTIYTIRRIVQNIDKNNTSDAVGKRMNLFVQAIEQGSDFGELARRYSQDVAAANGGVLIVDDFSQPEKINSLLQNLKPNQATLPIQTSSNWQIIQLLDKKTETDPVKIQREAVRRLLIQQGRAQAHQQFIEQLQQNAVVREF